MVGVSEDARWEIRSEAVVVVRRYAVCTEEGVWWHEDERIDRGGVCAGF